VKERKALGGDLVIPVAAIAFTAYFLHSTSGLQWEAKANGVIIGIALIVLCAIQIARIGIHVAREHGSLSLSTLVSPPDAFRKRVGIMAITVAFVVTLPWLGLGLGLFVALAAGFWLLGVRGPRHVLLVSFAVVAVCEGLFTFALDIGLPRGPVELLLAHFTG